MPGKAIDVKSTEVARKGNVTPTTLKTENAPPRQGPTRTINQPTPQQSSPPKTQKVSHTVSVKTPSASGSTDTIVVCTMVIMGSALVKDVAHGTPSVKPIVTGMILGGVLLIIGTFAPTFAKLLAITGLVGALMTNGSALISAGKIH